MDGNSDQDSDRSNSDERNLSSNDNTDHNTGSRGGKTTSSDEPTTISLTSTSTVSRTTTVQRVTSRGPPIPLTTTFTPPSACLNELWQTQSDNGKWLHMGPLNTTECLPSGWSPSSYFSPGVCPSGWVMATKSTTSIQGEVETVGTCCPRYINWDFNTRPLSTHTYPWYETEICQWSPNTELIYNLHSSIKGGTQRLEATMTPGGVWNAYGIVVRWKPSDHVSAATATATKTPTPIHSKSASDSQSGSSGRLSPGAKAGIGVGVAVGGVAVLFAIAFFILRCRKQREKAGNVSQEIENPHHEKMPHGPDLAELLPNPVFEMDDSSTASQKPVQSPIELDASGAK